VRPPRETLSEHLAIIEAIAGKDPERAEETVRLHLKRSREKLMGEAEEEKASAVNGEELKAG
jgi:DNA-binding GntR family transcriptional regulator